MFFIVSLGMYAQGEMDAFNLSRNGQMGTARAISMGGAFGALGGDITGVAQNPAGIGVYRSSEVVASMGFTSNNIETNTAKESKFKFAFDNVSYMGYMPLSDNVFKSFNFGFSYNRLKDFDRNYTASGKNRNTSLADYTAIISNKISSSNLDIIDNPNAYYQDLPWMSLLGYNLYNRPTNTYSGIIYNADNINGKDYYESQFNGYELNDNSLTVSEEGHIESYDFTMGTNISNKLYLGFTFSITDIFYRMDSYYVEDFLPVTSDKIGFDLENWLESKGAGYQVSIGAIFRPTDALRLGLAYHSPTWYDMQDLRYGDMIANLPYETVQPWGGHAPDDNDIAEINYKLQTPGRWVASAAAILGAKAILSLDYEYIDYSQMKLKYTDGFEYQEDNSFISEHFKRANTLKAGIEYRATSQFSLRAGYSWIQSPLEAKIKNGKQEVVLGLNSTAPHYVLEGDANTMSYGLGYKFTPNFYIDLAFSFKFQDNDLYAFSPLFADDGRQILASTSSKFKNNTFKGLLTLGYKF